MTELSELGQAALKYASLGLHVFPCAPGEKRPFTPNGHQDATDDAQQITHWWTTNPSANIGLFLKPSNLVAIDPDTYKPECEWEKIIAKRGELPSTWTQETPRGGRHYIFRAEPGVEYAGKAGEGVDVKWDGYILLAPSFVAEFEKPYVSIENRYLARAPDWLPRKPVAELLDLSQFPGQVIPQGQRSDAMHRMVLDLHNRGYSGEGIVWALLADPDATGASRFDGDEARVRADVVRILSKHAATWGVATTAHGRQMWEGSRQVQRTAFRLKLAGEFEATDPVWLIENLIEVGCLVLLFGDPGAGKSFLAIDWAYCVATGTPFFGREVKSGTVVYVAGEGHRGFGRRREAWGAHHGVDTKAAPVYLSTGPANMLEALEQVRTAIAPLDPPALIVFDTLARNFGNGDENSTKDMSAFVAAVDDLRADYPDCVVLIVHHSGHAEKQRARGAMALKGAVDTEYRLDTEKGLRLVNTKMKDGETPQPIPLVLKEVGRSAVLVEDDNQPTDIKKISNREALALQAFVDAAIGIGHKGDDSPVPTEAWRQAFYNALPPEVGRDAREQSFRHIRKTLQEKGKLMQDGEDFRPLEDVKMRICILPKTTMRAI